MLAKGKGKYCSRGCIQHPKGEANPLHGKSRSQGFELTCQGCGAKFWNRRSRVRYCSLSCRSKDHARKPTAGNRQVMKIGYIRLTLPTGERVLEHRWVWEQAHGPIPPGALIHHKNEVKTDNRLENLQLIESMSAHNAEHGGSLRGGKYQRKVPTCHPDRPHRALGLCLACYMKHRRGTL